MVDPDEGFLRRWSRRKQADRQHEPDDRPAEPDPGDAIAADATDGPAGDAGTPLASGEEEDTETLVARLPDIETLTDKSDFRPFMDPRIPEALRNRALRKLWRSNPVFANLDGLNDYDEDYTDAAMVVPGLKTAYQVGRGIVRKALDLPPEAEPEGAGQIAAADGKTADEPPSAADEPAGKEDGGTDRTESPTQSAPESRNKLS